MSRQSRLLSVLAVVFISASAHAQPPRGPEILIDDVTRFYELYAATGGKPTAEQLEHEYMAKSTPSFVEFAKLRRVTARSIADRIAKDPSIYEKQGLACKCFLALRHDWLRLADSGLAGWPAAIGRRGAYASNTPTNSTSGTLCRGWRCC